MSNSCPWSHCVISLNVGAQRLAEHDHPLLLTHYSYLALNGGYIDVYGSRVEFLSALLRILIPILGCTASMLLMERPGKLNGYIIVNQTHKIWAVGVLADRNASTSKLGVKIQCFKTVILSLLMSLVQQSAWIKSAADWRNSPILAQWLDGVMTDLTILRWWLRFISTLLCTQMMPVVAQIHPFLHIVPLFSFHLHFELPLLDLGAVCILRLRFPALWINMLSITSLGLGV